MWAEYYSEDGNWKAYDKDIIIKGGSNKKHYNPKTKRMERDDAIRHIWILEKNTGERFDQFKTLKAAKEFAENYIAE
jgi:hypothetical protein